MKRLLSICIGSCLVLALTAQAQDAATEERFNRLSGQIEDLITAHKALQKQLTTIAERVEELREQAAKPNVSYITQEDLKPLADSIREVDRKRIQDAEKIQNQLIAIQKLAASTPPPRSPDKPVVVADRPEKGFEHEVKSGETLSTIVQAFREQNVKVTVDQVIKANPGLKPERMLVGQKIFIPAP